MLSLLKLGYLEVIEAMTDTLDYANNINVLHRLTKRLKEGRAEPQDAGDLDVFTRVENFSNDFITRIREYEMEHVHAEVKFNLVTKE